MFNFIFSSSSFLPAGSPSSASQPAPSLTPSPPSVQPVTIQAQIQGLTSSSPLLTTTASPPVQTIAPHVQQVPVRLLDWLLCLFYGHHILSHPYYSACLFSQVLLQPQFIKAESLLLTTLKHDPCMVTTMASPTSLASTTPVQSTSLQVGTSHATIYCTHNICM